MASQCGHDRCIPELKELTRRCQDDIQGRCNLEASIVEEPEPKIVNRQPRVISAWEAAIHLKAQKQAHEATRAGLKQRY